MHKSERQIRKRIAELRAIRAIDESTQEPVGAEQAERLRGIARDNLGGVRNWRLRAEVLAEIDKAEERGKGERL